jgi:hypothetical protein
MKRDEKPEAGCLQSPDGLTECNTVLAGNKSFVEDKGFVFR